MVFRRPSYVPSEHAQGRLVIKEPLRNGDLCRWCHMPLKVFLGAKPEYWVLRCPRCDHPLPGDHTVLKAE